MVEKVVYILGAGFSAPLGLPVMSNFISKAKDLYFTNENRYSHFSEIFDLLDKMAVIKNYFKTDLHNIEEILSILEMNDYLIGQSNTEKFKTFLKEVIEHYTPIPNEVVEMPGNYWNELIFGSESNLSNYGFFVAELFNLKIIRDTTNRTPEFKFKKKDNPKVVYSVISLNYDLILENAMTHLNNNYDVENISFNKTGESKENSVTLSKLHGCIEMGNIVPPTWNKTSNSALVETWKVAQKQLTEANHIRILGYSLPLSDSYMKYMLKSSLLGSKHLKSIDVITLDPTGEVKERYDEFIDFNNYNFKIGDIKSYLSALKKRERSEVKLQKLDRMEFDRMEDVHKNFMNA